MLEVTEQRPMNNEYVNIMNLPGILVNIANKKPRGQWSDVIVPDFPLSGKRNYVVEEFSAKHQRAIISWDHYPTTQAEGGSGIPCQFFIACSPTTFKRKATMNNILI